MRSVFISWLAVISSGFALAQPSNPSVFNSTGFELPAENSYITISIGEPAIITLQATSSVITQGYLQPMEPEPCTAVSFNYYPNPAREFLTIDPVGCDAQVEQVQIFDMWGRKLSTVAPAADNKVDLGDLSQGLYVFKVMLTGGASGNFNAIKVSQ